MIKLSFFLQWLRLGADVFDILITLFGCENAYILQKGLRCSTRRKKRKIIGFSVEIFNAFSIEQRKNLLVNGFFDYCSNWW